MKKITIKDMAGLSTKEAFFVVEYCKDFDHRRAASASGHKPGAGKSLIEQVNVGAAVDRVLLARLESYHVDAAWVLNEAVDNHYIARQIGNITASNTALTLIAKHTSVDAFAADKIDFNLSKDVMERLIRGRLRLKKTQTLNDEVSFL